jgi:hypothetical protein
MPREASAVQRARRAARDPERLQGFIYMHGLAGMHLSSHPYVVQARFPWGTLPFDMQELIRDHTATSFAVESDFTMRFRFPEVSWTNVQYVLRYEFQLMPRELSTRPEIEVRVTRVLDPAFKQSRLFIESDVSMQDMLVNNFKEIKFSAISQVKLEMRHESGEQLPFVQFVSRANGVDRVFRTPFWSAINQNKIEELQHKLKSFFHMEFGN